MSRPTIVEATLEFSEDRFPRHAVEPYGLVFSAILFDAPDLSGGTEVCHAGPIFPADLSRFLQPGDPDYDRHDRLPRR